MPLCLTEQIMLTPGGVGLTNASGIENNLWGFGRAVPIFSFDPNPKFFFVMKMLAANDVI